MKNSIPTLAAVALLGSAGLSPAAVILAHGLNNTTNADSVDPLLNYATGITLQDGYTTSGRTEGTHVAYFNNTSMTTVATPTVSDIKFSFSLTPDAGYGIAFDATNTVTWDIMAWANTGTTGGLTVYSKLFVSKTSDFSVIEASSSIFSVVAASNASIISNTNPFLNYTGDENYTGPLYFGFAFTDNSGSTAKNGRMDNILINGSLTAVPEPSAALLGGLGVLALLRRRRA